MSRHFTYEEAEAKVGTWVKTRVALAGAKAGVKAGTMGRVAKADKMRDGWGVVIYWDWPRTLHDLFTKDEYDHYLEEI
jgi:hypothetical protein